MTTQVYRLSVEIISEKAKAAIDGLKGKLEGLEKQSGQFADKYKEITAAAGVAFGGIVAATVGATKESIKFEKALAGIKKVVDFKAPDGLDKMRTSLEQLSTQIPVPFEELAQIAAAGGQLGVAEDKLVEFTKVTANMATAFDMSADVAGDSMAKLSNVFGKPIDQMAEFGDMINTVSNNMPAKASEIVESLTRVGGVGKTFGLTEKQTVALTSAMISLGKAPEVASTGINSMLTTLSTLDVKNKDVSSSLSQMGIDATEFGNRLKTDGYGAIMQLLDGINKLPKDQQIGMVTDIFGKNFGDDIVQLAGAPDVLAKINGLLAEQQNYIGSMKKEAENVSNTTEAKIQMFQNSFSNAKAAIGDAFRPALAGMMEALAPVLEKITQFAKENPTLVSSMMIFTGVFTGLVAAIAAVGAIMPVVTAGFALMGTTLGVAGLPVVAIVAAIAALVTIGVALYQNWDTLGQKASEVWNGIKQWASDAWQGVVDKWNGFTEWFGGLFDGFGLDGIWDSLTSGVSSAWESVKTTIAQKWENIKAWFSGNSDLLSGVWQSIKDGVSNAWDSIKQAVIDKFNQIKEAFNEWLSGQPAPMQEMIDNIISIFTGLVAGIGAIWGFVGSGASAAWDGIKTAASTAKEWVQSTWEGLSSGLSSTWESIKSGASSAWESAKSTASSAWESVKNTVSSKLEQAKTNASKLSDGVARGWDNAKELAGRAFDGVKNAIGDKLGQAKDTAKSKFDEIKNSISNSGIGEAMSKGLNTLTSIASSALNGVKAVFSAAITAWRAILQAGLAIFATLFNTAFNTIKTVVQTAFAVIKGVITGDVNAIKTAFSNGFNQLGNIARQAGQNILSAFKNLGLQLLQAGRDAVQGFINGFTGKMGEALSKAREMASKIISTVKGALDIHSPSRVMKALGGYAGEGFVLGLGEKVKDAKQAAQDLANAVTSTISELHKNHFMLQNHANPLAELDYKLQFGELADLTNKQKTRIKELAQANLDLAKSNETLTGFNNQMADLNRQITLLGVTDPIKQLEYDLANTEKYAGYTTEQLDKLKSKMMELESTKALQGFNSELEKATTEMQKQEYLLKNIGDKYAGMKFDLAQKGYNSEQIGQVVGVQQRTDTISAFAKLQTNLKDGKAFTLPTFSGTGLEGAGNALASGISGMASLDKQYQEQLDIIRQARQAQLDINADYDKQEYDLKAAHEAAKRELTLSSAEGIASGLAGATKAMFGEQSKVYRAMFAVEKGVAIARSIMAIQQAIAFAAANPFPMNIGAMASVAAQTASIISNIRAVKNPVVGQAHDGIMSVPKSGTWNLEKGERVLPRHTAKALDDKLDSVGNGTNQINIHINIDNNGNEQSPNNAQGTAKILADNIKAVVLQTLHQEKKQGGLLA